MMMTRKEPPSLLLLMLASAAAKGAELRSSLRSHHHRSLSFNAAITEDQYQQCLMDMLSSDENGDYELNAQEFIRFVTLNSASVYDSSSSVDNNSTNSTSATTWGYSFGQQSLDQLPINFAMLFYSQACLCSYDGEEGGDAAADSTCCSGDKAHVDIYAGPKYDGSITEKQDIYVREFCTESYHAYSLATFAPTNAPSSICSMDGTSNWQGPLPVSSNTVLQFVAFGDSPYDANANTCIGKDGQPQNPCKRYNCTKNEVQSGNTCTYEGPEYQCVKESIIPYINRKIASGGAAFALHVGDIIKGGGKCSEASFESRKALFSQSSNFLLVPGDNEWNECQGHNITSNNDAMSMLWRAKFASEQSPFHKFSDDFPSAVGGGRPDVIRHIENPEILFFTYNDIAFFGLNLPGGLDDIEQKLLVDKNAKWIQDNLDKDRCNLKSIVLFGHTDNTSSTYNEKLQSYYDACSTIPTLVIVGNSHPTNYCMKKNSEYRFTLTIEAFLSGPLLVSVVRDADGNHYFHVLDKDMLNSNGVCPDLSHTD